MLGIQSSFLLVSSYFFCQYLSLVCFHLLNLLFDSLIGMAIYSLYPFVPTYLRLSACRPGLSKWADGESVWECSLGILQMLQRWHKRPASMGDSRGDVLALSMGGEKARHRDLGCWESDPEPLSFSVEGVGEGNG